eukprot:3713514-Amphidinium_carterae.2
MVKRRMNHRNQRRANSSCRRKEPVTRRHHETCTTNYVTTDGPALAVRLHWAVQQESTSACGTSLPYLGC